MRRLDIHKPTGRKFSARWAVLLAIWLVCIAAGFFLLWSYGAQAGPAAVGATHWPPVAIQRQEGRLTLVMLAHPRCPCTRASISELARLMANTRGRIDAHVLFLRPPGASGEWVEGHLWQSAGRIPGVRVWVDDGGEMARRFGAVTSGHVIVYDAQGVRQFSGGITPSRGHEGDSLGKQQIIALSRSEGVAGASAVYGCELGASDSNPPDPSSPERSSVAVGELNGGGP